MYESAREAARVVYALPSGADVADHNAQLFFSLDHAPVAIMIAEARADWAGRHNLPGLKMVWRGVAYMITQNDSAEAARQARLANDKHTPADAAAPWMATPGFLTTEQTAF